MIEQLVDEIDNDTTYQATITFQSRGRNESVVQITKFSHVFPDGYKGDLPASYAVVRDINMALAQFLQMMAAKEMGIDFDSLDDDKIDDILNHIEKSGGTKH